jgi:hypothetical protein
VKDQYQVQLEILISMAEMNCVHVEVERNIKTVVEGKLRQLSVYNYELR